MSWALSGDLDGFYAGLRWPGWQEITESLALDQGVTVYPPPFTTEGSSPTASRAPAPFGQLLASYDDMAAQLANVPDRGQFHLGVTE